MRTVIKYLRPSVPNDHSHQCRAIEMARLAVLDKRPRTIVDLGCGEGLTADLFRQWAPDSRWIGVDIEASPEVAKRVRSDVEFVAFDGVILPFESGSVDLIFCNQVLEHVRYPEDLLKEVARTLSEDGKFIGQTSQLEPYHSFSYWNFTVYGFKRICEDAGLEVIELRPGIDGSTLFQRSYLRKPPEYSKWFVEESPINREIEEVVSARGLGVRPANMRKLKFCGQFCFSCKRSNHSIP